MAIMMCVVLTLNALVVYAQEENEFTIVDGVLEKYNGSAAEVVVPEGVTVIGKKAFSNNFSGNTTITKVVLPSTLTTIEEYAFFRCTNLAIPEFPASLTTIGKSAFGTCYASRADVVIPGNISYIGSWAFHLCGCEKLTINGNNTTIAQRAFSSGFVGAEDCTHLDYLKEAVLNGSFTYIEGVFDGRSKLQNVTINGTIEKLTDGFYACESLQTLTVNGNINEITNSMSADNSIFMQSPDLTIYGKEGSYIQEYAEKHEIPFVVIETEEAPVLKNEVTLTEDNTNISKSYMQTLVDNNKADDVIIRTNGGVVFTFPKDSMKMLERDSFDFGVNTITEYDEAGLRSLPKDKFAFTINYNYSGELPGAAQVSIPIDAKWNGQKLHYYQIDENGNLLDTKVSASVINGVYTIPLSHCSDYVAVIDESDNSGVSRPSDNNNKNQATDGSSKKPITGNNNKKTTVNINTNQPLQNGSNASGTVDTTQAVFIPVSASNSANAAQKENTDHTANDSAKNTAPQTGDCSALFLYAALALIAVGIALKTAKRQVNIK